MLKVQCVMLRPRFSVRDDGSPLHITQFTLHKRVLCAMTMRSRFRFLLVDGTLVALWLASVGLVVLHERGQLWGGLSNPMASLEATLDAKEQWFGIYYQGQKIGFSHMTLMPEEREGIPGIAILDKGRLSFNLLNTP